MKTFSVGWILETLGAQQGLNVETDGIDDVCFGYVDSSDKTFAQILSELRLPYNFYILDGDPIRLVRKDVNDALVVDLDINEADCIKRDKQAPAITFSRVDPASLPRQVEIQHIDPDRDYAVSTQVARHTAAPLTNAKLSIALDFVISAQQARDIAFDVLYRLWGQQLQVGFEYPDLRIENADVLRVTADQGVFIIIVTQQTINMPSRTNSIMATALLTSKGTTIVTAPEADPYVPNQADELAAWIVAAA